ncbi:ASPARTYL PROTEASE FAMILY PROTEIN putative-RELATED [Salix viminalis]|uniref:ASPARTYL PROTEASE FAMILY PROTEIN putative-RELATED n=1 Tax=Salix viminalis TaxID=40686 RepID=A0A9Q0NQ42_SALVM|nr:ASPARTYL PROTEASE FAMILY PROTEIN putative-RELATED [Salix viminalis]
MCLWHSIWGLLVFGRILRCRKANLNTYRGVQQYLLWLWPKQPRSLWWLGRNTWPSSTGFLTFGGSASKNSKFTPLSTISASSSFYGLDFTGISVGGTKLAISASVFSTAGAIIDSGTTITWLPPAAYSELRASFRNLMSNYPLTSALGTLDTCYDFSSYSTISVPKIGFFFSSGIEVDIDVSGVFFASSISQVCLAFAGNSDAADLLIFGNVQQKTLEVFYDGSAGKVGFAPGGCS